MIRISGLMVSLLLAACSPRAENDDWSNINYSQPAGPSAGGSAKPAANVACADEFNDCATHHPK